jgi:hypothetical protein
MDVLTLIFMLPLVSFFIPRTLFPLYIWLLLVCYSLYSFPSSHPYMDKSLGDTLGEAFLDFFLLVLVVSVLIKLSIILVFFLREQIKQTYRANHESYGLVNQITGHTSSAVQRRSQPLTFGAYGILAGYYFYLWLTDFLQDYQPAWEAYLIVIVIILLLFLASRLLQRFRNHTFALLKYLSLFVLCSSWMLGLLTFSSYGYAAIAKKQTEKIVRESPQRDNSYCIQPKISTWLDLTPLTKWNKRSRDWGAGKNHAVFVIQSSKNTELHNWSYKQRKWDYLASEFIPNSFDSPSELRCNLDSNYLKNTPFLFPKPIQLNLGNQNLKVPHRYFASQEKNIMFKDSRGEEGIKFLATGANFSSIQYIFTKLPLLYQYHTEVVVYKVINNKDLNYILNMFQQNYQELDSQYGLNRRYSPKTQHSPKSIEYYQIKNNAIDTVIRCRREIGYKMNCRHRFIRDGLVYEFSHSEKDIKNWQNLQTNLVKLVRS